MPEEDRFLIGRGLGVLWETFPVNKCEFSVRWITQEWFIFSNVWFFWCGSNTGWRVGMEPESFVNGTRIGVCWLTHHTETSPLGVTHQTTPEEGQCDVGEETLHIWQLFYFALLVFLSPPSSSSSSLLEFLCISTFPKVDDLIRTVSFLSPAASFASAAPVKRSRSEGRVTLKPY